MGPEGGDSVFFRADESKETEGVEYAEDVADGGSTMAGAEAGAEATNVAVEVAKKQKLTAAPEHLTTAAIQEADGGDEEEGGGISAGEPSPVRHADSSSLPSRLSDKMDTIQGEGGEDAGGREWGGGREEESRAATQAAAAAVVADEIGSDESLRSTEAVADNAVAESAAPTQDVTPRGRAAAHVRPPPIVTEDVAPILHTSSSEMPGRGGNVNDNTGDADEGASMDPEQMRRCFVAKTFSPSDLGLGELRGSDNGGGGAVSEEVTKESLMRARRRRRTFQKGITGIDGRRHTVDEVLGLDDPQAVLGSVPPERLFSITGMFHPEAPVKVKCNLCLLLTGNFSPNSDGVL